MKNRYLLLLFILAGLGCGKRNNERNLENSSDKILKLLETSIELQNIVFPQKREPIRQEKICYFNDKSCPSCIYCIKERVDLLGCEDFKFYTNIENEYLSDIKKMIPETISISVDSIFEALPYPVLFETDGTGRIINCLPISLDYIFLNYKYLDDICD